MAFNPVSPLAGRQAGHPQMNVSPKARKAGGMAGGSFYFRDGGSHHD